MWLPPLSPNECIRLQNNAHRDTVPTKYKVKEVFQSRSSDNFPQSIAYVGDMEILPKSSECAIYGFLYVAHVLVFRTEPNVSESGSVSSEDGNVRFLKHGVLLSRIHTCTFCWNTTM
jgi:hypothetical protein